MTFTTHLREAARLAREKDGLTGIPDGLDKAAQRLDSYEETLKRIASYSDETLSGQGQADVRWYADAVRAMGSFAKLALTENIGR